MRCLVVFVDIMNIKESGWCSGWWPAVGEEHRCERKRPQNPMDPYAVVVKKDGITVGKSMWSVPKMFNIVNNRCEKIHVLNFCCLAEL